MIKGLQGKDGTITTETREMTLIAFEYHKELQEKPQMMKERRNTIKKAKKNINSRLQEE